MVDSDLHDSDPVVTILCQPTNGKSGEWVERNAAISEVCELVRTEKLSGSNIVCLPEDENVRQSTRALGIPLTFWDELHDKASGFFEAYHHVDGEAQVQAYNTAFRLLIKMPGSKASKKSSVDLATQYHWHKIGCWTHWTSGGTSILFCFEDTHYLRQRIQNYLRNDPTDISFAAVQHRTISTDTPFAMHAFFMSQIAYCLDEAVWAWQSHIRYTEKMRPRVDAPKSDQDFYDFVHALSRHVVHCTEMLTTTINVLGVIADESSDHTFSMNMKGDNKRDQNDFRALKRQRAMLQCVQERSRALEARLQSEIMIAYNVNAQHDTRLSAQIAEATLRDSNAMRAIAFLGLLFLPNTFISALFSMSFFNFQPATADTKQRWTVSDDFWIYWATAIPFTILTMLIWYLWQSPLRQKIDVKDWLRKAATHWSSLSSQHSMQLAKGNGADQAWRMWWTRLRRGQHAGLKKARQTSPA